MTANDIKPDSRFFGLFIGESSSGKDCAFASFPKPMLVFDADLRRGIIGAKKWIGEEEFKGIELKQFTPLKGFVDVEKELNFLSGLIEKNQCPYKTVVLNSLTSFDRLFMTDAFEYLAGNFVGPKDAKGNVNKLLRLSGPADYKYLRAAFLNTFDFLRSWPINIIIVGHTVPRYVKVDPNSEYSETIQDGTRLSLTERLANDLLIYFDEAYEFIKSSTGDQFYVQFRSNIARTLYPLPHGRTEITGKNFFQLWQSLIGITPPLTTNQKG